MKNGKIIMITALVLSSCHVLGQTKFISKKYNYSFIIPDGWYSKEEIMVPDVDAKIVDGRGNSFIVTIKSFPTSSDLTATQMMEGVTNNDIEEQYNAIYSETKIVKRGRVFYDMKEFYYYHLLTPFKGDQKLYHKQFFYNEGYRMLSIDACSIDAYLDEVNPAFNIMLSTFEFPNLKNK
jgi:hypothetical protein